MALTITEALAEIKTIGKRVEAKRTSCINFMARMDGARDPLEKDGGSVQFIASERQSIADLTNRIVALRRGIQRANDDTVIASGGISKTISEWLTWRREIAPGHKAFLTNMQRQIAGVRAQAAKSGSVAVPAGTSTDRPTDFIINVSEQELAKQIENLEEILGSLDGQLSLKNATVTIKE